MSKQETEIKLGLKGPIINYDGKPVKDSTNLATLAQNNPGIPQDQLIAKCPNATFGKGLVQLLLMVPTQDNVEKLKLFRWASKIEDKLLTDKGELTLDLNQVIELSDFIGKVQNVPIVSIAPFLIKFDDFRSQLK